MINKCHTSSSNVSSFSGIMFFLQMSSNIPQELHIEVVHVCIYTSLPQHSILFTWVIIISVIGKLPDPKDVCIFYASLSMQHQVDL